MITNLLNMKNGIFKLSALIFVAINILIFTGCKDQRKEGTEDLSYPDETTETRMEPYDDTDTLHRYNETNRTDQTNTDHDDNELTGDQLPNGQ